MVHVVFSLGSALTSVSLHLETEETTRELVVVQVVVVVDSVVLVVVAVGVAGVVAG